VLGSESALVDDITTPGGVRALPDPADLRRFVDTVSNMDGLCIADLLRQKMVSLPAAHLCSSYAVCGAMLCRTVLRCVSASTGLVLTTSLLSGFHGWTVTSAILGHAPVTCSLLCCGCAVLCCAVLCAA
jgi:hypothetical protein